jgi:hypothetical protein
VTIKEDNMVPVGTKLHLDGATCTVTGYSSGQGYRVAFSSGGSVSHGWVPASMVEKEWTKQIDRKFAEAFYDE